MNIDVAMFHQAYFEEAADLLVDLERELLELESLDLESGHQADPERLNTIFRCAHSLKGGAATFGFAEIAAFTHGLETLLDRVRNNVISVDRNLTQILFESLDHLKILFAVARGEESHAPDATLLTERILAAAEVQPIVALPHEKPAPAQAPAEAEGAVMLDTPKSKRKSGKTSKDTGKVACTVASPPTWADEPAPVGPDSEDWWGVWSLPKVMILRFSLDADALSHELEAATVLDQLREAGEVLSSGATVAEAHGASASSTWTIDIMTDWDAARITELLGRNPAVHGISLEEAGRSASEPDTAAEIAAPLDESVTAIGEAVEAPSRLSGSDPAAASPVTRPSRKPAAGASGDQIAKFESQTLRVATEKVDKLINLVGELVINQSMLNDVAQNFDMTKLPRLLEAVAQMEHASRELQERVMAVRMLPIRHAFGRFPRLVRDMGASNGKQIELKTFGEDTELDKAVIEAIADPLTHLVRNSVDHGLESPSERVAAGKPPTGVVTLDAYQEGGSIVVNVSDDGRGLDRARILAKAVERGLVAPEDNPSDDQIYALIFEPGFSTADQVTDVSGRGVGMDIVRNTISGLGGSVSVSTVAGQGSRFRIRLPLTMAILEGLSVRVGTEVYILPLTSIVESIRPQPGDINLIAGSIEVVQVRGAVLPVVRLYRSFGVEPTVTDPTAAILVIVENERKRVALLVDELVTQSQVVIKSIERNYRKIDYIAGATIMGDGRVALILDVPSLIMRAHECGSTLCHQAREAVVRDAVAGNRP